MKVKIASTKEINNSKERWNHLVKSMTFPTVFLSWEWITTWIKHFGSNYNVVVLFVFHQSELRAILPLAQRAVRLKDGFLKVNTITLCGSMELYPDHLDVICSKEDNANIYIEQILEFIVSQCNDWNILHFRFLAGEGNLASWFESKHQGYRIKASNKVVAPYVPMDDSISSLLLKNMSSKRRHELRRQKRVLLEKRNVSFRKVLDCKELHSKLEDLFKLHKDRKDEENIKSTFEGPKTYGFHREISQLFNELGWLRFYLLESGGEPISAAYGFVFDGRFSFYQSGMDPQWNKYSPGKIIIFAMIEDMFNEGIIEFDFLGGEYNYKTFWSKESRTMVTFNIFNKNITASLEYWANNLRECLKSSLIRTFCYDSLRRLFGKGKV